MLSAVPAVPVAGALTEIAAATTPTGPEMAWTEGSAFCCAQM